MITIQSAIKIAQDNLNELFPSAMGVLLEEVEISEDANEWLITLSIPDTSIGINNFMSMMPRKYKLFIINAASGEFKGMKIRNV